MAFDTREKRAGAMGIFILPILPDPDGATFTQADRQQVIGVYPGILAAAKWFVGSRGRLTIIARERYDYGKAGWYPDAIIN